MLRVGRGSSSDISALASHHQQQASANSITNVSNSSILQHQQAVSSLVDGNVVNNHYLIAMDCDPSPARYRQTARYNNKSMSYAPASLPVELTGQTDQTNSYIAHHHHHHNQYGGTQNSLVHMGGFASTTAGYEYPNVLQDAKRSNTLNSSSTSGSGGQNEQDDSPMVGVCVQQSPVVIH